MHRKEVLRGSRKYSSLIATAALRNGLNALLRLFIAFSQFVPKYICTIGIDFGVKPVKVSGREVRINFWDVSGH